MNNNYFGYNLRYLRKCYHLSQEKMGRIVGKSFSAIVKETLDTYSHFFPSETDIITDKMDEILKKST